MAKFTNISYSSQGESALKYSNKSTLKVVLLAAAGVLVADGAMAADSYKVGYSSPFLTDPGQVVQVEFATEAAKKDGVTLLPP